MTQSSTIASECRAWRILSNQILGNDESGARFLLNCRVFLFGVMLFADFYLGKVQKTSSSMGVIREQPPYILILSICLSV